MPWALWGGRRLKDGFQISEAQFAAAFWEALCMEGSPFSCKKKGDVGRMRWETARRWHALAAPLLERG